MITRFLKIKKYRIFRNFVWNKELPTFAQFNVIYGWNGSGKTALSVLFEHLQKKSAISEGEVVFELDDMRKIHGNEIPNANVPSVRVFNRDFIAHTIAAIDKGDVDPIYILGEESVALQKQVETLKTEFVDVRRELDTFTNNKVHAHQEIDRSNSGEARLIKEALLGSTKHANYDKNTFHAAVSEMKNRSSQLQRLSDQQKEEFIRQKGMQVKASIPKVSISISNIQNLCLQTLGLLKKTIVSQIINDLKSDHEVSDWVHQGLSLHKGVHKTNICRFCKNELSQKRREELEAHFNDAFESFQRNIEQTIENIQTQQQFLGRSEFPDEARFYDKLSNKAREAIEFAKQRIVAINSMLDQFNSALEEKKSAPFKPLTLEVSESAMKSSVDSLSVAIDEVNAIIEEHKKITTSFAGEIEKAYKILEDDHVLEALPRFKELEKAAIEADGAFTNAENRYKDLVRQIKEMEHKIIKHRRPAEELNQEIREYLGHDELRLETKDTGYMLMRGAQPAQYLSEGERTAIAFLYFLKTLQDREFDMKTGIVVIDDPVSSLDSNSLFSAFGYMKERTKECYQLFILTHNDAFFRQVKNWFYYLKKGRGRFYWLSTKFAGGERQATLSELDRLLKDFDSDYHFLFKQVHDTATSYNSGLEQYYGMPNIARRLLEIFLAYRFPDSEKGLHKQIEHTKIDQAEKTSIIRFLHSYSHSDGFGGSEPNLSALAETKKVMNTILNLMKNEDCEHYTRMKRLIQTQEIKE